MVYNLGLCREAVDFRFLISRFSRPADVGTAKAPHGRYKRRWEVRKPFGHPLWRATKLYGSGSGPLRTTAIAFAMKKETAGEKPLVRDRALLFSPRAPFAFVTKIPKNANKNAGDTAGGVRGGMPCRPPSVVCDGAICDDSEFFAKLRGAWDDVRIALIMT